MDRPVVHHLVCFIGPDGDLLSEPRIVPDDEAADQRAWGASTLPDPEDEAVADLWDVYQSDLRSSRRRKAWFDR